jgi:ABC-type antimicrobial peptide transport system permease subunit
VKLVDARELAREAQRNVAHGGDPVVEKRAAREVLTFGKLADTYIEDYAKLNKKSWEEGLSSVLARWSIRNVNDPIVLIAAAGTLLLSTAVATLIPARRATAINPTIALKIE